MNLLPRTHEEFSKKEYWNKFFKKRGKQAFEWYGEYLELCGHLHKYIKPKDNVLIVGCGNSTIGENMYDVGYKNIVNIDISEVVIKHMMESNKLKRPDLKFEHMDALNMSFEESSISAIIDKGTLDALMPNDNPDTLEVITKYFQEIARVLRVGGRYVCISLLQEHVLAMLTKYFPDNNFLFRVVRSNDTEDHAREKGEFALPVFVVVCTKFKLLPTKILEVCMGTDDVMQRLNTVEEVKSSVKTIQQVALVISGIKNTTIEDEIEMDLCGQQDSNARYTLFIVDDPVNRNNDFAAFVVPQGRESEWLFSTTVGRRKLSKMVKRSRLVIITMHRDQVYVGWEEIKQELSNSVANLSPPGCTTGFDFLSLENEMGRREIQFRGHSEFSGNFVVEDIEIMPGNKKFRRLFYMGTQFAIQSEAKLGTVKGKHGRMKEIVDPTFLSCRHHLYMCIGTKISFDEQDKCNVLVVGLGGGGLCSFLHRWLPQVSITAVEIDAAMLQVAKEWFGLVLDKNLSVAIQDGIVFLQEAAKKNKRYDAILFDVDSKDTKIGMSCPPKQFLDDSVLANVLSCLKFTGFFILNLVLRDESLRAGIVSVLESKFKTVVAYKLVDDLNEVFFCSKGSHAKKAINAKVMSAVEQMNSFVKDNGVEDEVIDMDDLVGTFKLQK